jgi:hypothetical protein
MNRRLHERYQVNLKATVTDIAAQDRIASGTIADISQSGLCAVVSLQFATGAIVKVEIGDCALFGQVTYSNPEGPLFRTGIDVVRVLIGESDLSRFVNTVLAEMMPSTPGVRVNTSW